MGTDTIAAIATPYGRGGIGIIRISGKAALGIAEVLFRPSAGNRTDTVETHRFYHGRILDPPSGRILDEVMMVYMKSPRSYTREDVVEIHTHSGPAALRAVLDRVFAQGARPAAPGEFTRRAFLNGRIDLSQAEAVIDVVNARTQAALEIAAAQIQGGLRKRIEACRDVLSHVQAEMTVAIDFPEDVETEIPPEMPATKLRTEVVFPLERLLQQYDRGRVFREGLRVVVAGLPNVGKSSLVNALLERERAIVSPYPGTTRDFIEESLDLYGFQAIVVDTAGLQETRDPVERIGIEKTREKIQEADVLVFMVDPTRPEGIQNGLLPGMEKPTILVINKVDRVGPGWNPKLPESWTHLPVVRTSALHGSGLDTLREAISQQISQGMGFEPEDPIVPNARQKAALERALESTRAAEEGLSTGRSPELVCMDVSAAVDGLNEILGETLRPDVLDAVFSRFCIGK